MKPHLSPCHHVYLSWALSHLEEVLVIGPNMTMMTMYVFFDLFLSYQMGVI